MTMNGGIRSSNVNHDENGNVGNSTSGPKLSSRIRSILLDKVRTNRVTIVIGPTGCGKSTLVPSFLLDNIGGKVLCSQPRRLAVVSVAKRVAEMRASSNGRNNNDTINTTIPSTTITAASTTVSTIDWTNSDVGYHVGQHNESSTKRTKLLFVTAGILFEELRAKGMEVLDTYSCIILDECHERSVESDLCLVILQQLLAQQKSGGGGGGGGGGSVRIVLMSATFDHTRYRNFFQNKVPGCDHVDCITLETAESYEAYFNQVQTFYLDDIVPLRTSKSHTSPIFTKVCDSSIVLSEHEHQEFYHRHALYRHAMDADPDSDLMDENNGSPYGRQGRRGKGDNKNANYSLSTALLDLITHILQVLDQTEPPGAVFLVFAPTYRHLEQLYEVLQLNWSNSGVTSELYLAVLHSSVDIDDCLRSMQEDVFQSGGIKRNRRLRRRILLASAIADSSITIPGVSCVIDTCRSLHVTWDNKNQVHQTKTVWASRSICDQRQGRTGRTCPGRVFRLLPKNFYLSELMEFETPAILGSDCRNECLALVSSKSADITEKSLFSSLDPPDSSVVDAAVLYLQKIGACTMSGGRQRQKLISTEYGNLISALPFQVAESQRILTAAQHGFLHEMLLFQTIQSVRPCPIKTYFADESSCVRALYRYLNDVNPKDATEKLSAHMSAYMHWDNQWNIARRSYEFKRFHRMTGSTGPQPTTTFLSLADTPDGADVRTGLNRVTCGAWMWSIRMEEEHVEWCRVYQINPTSLRAIAETMDVTIATLFQSNYEPEWLRCSRVDPPWQRSQSLWKEPNLYSLSSSQALRAVYGLSGTKHLRTALKELCSTAASNANKNNVLNQQTQSAENFLANLTRQVIGLPPLSDNQVLDSSDDDDDVYNMKHHDSGRDRSHTEPNVCIHFLEGNCVYGPRCRKSHSLTSKRPVCRFFLSGKCVKGDHCSYSHKLPSGNGSSTVVQSISRSNPHPGTLKACVPIIDSLVINGGARRWYKDHASRLLLLGEGNYKFTMALCTLGTPPYMATSLDDIPQQSLYLTSSVNIRGNVDATRLHTCRELMYSPYINYCAWNFPYTGIDEEEISKNEDLILAAFMSMALLFGQRTRTNVANSTDAVPPPPPQFGISLQRNQLSRWNVLRSARRACWSLVQWGEFESIEFPGYRPSRANGDLFHAEQTRFYVFEFNGLDYDSM